MTTLSLKKKKKNRREKIKRKGISRLARDAAIATVGVLGAYAVGSVLSSPPTPRKVKSAKEVKLKVNKEIGKAGQLGISQEKKQKLKSIPESGLLEDWPPSHVTKQVENEMFFRKEKGQKVFKSRRRRPYKSRTSRVRKSRKKRKTTRR